MAQRQETAELDHQRTGVCLCVPALYCRGRYQAGGRSARARPVGDCRLEARSSDVRISHRLRTSAFRVVPALDRTAAGRRGCRIGAVWTAR
jgi:hypothetical protein